MKNILITGATGTLGSALARELANQGHQLLLLDLDGSALDKMSADFPGEHSLIPFDLWRFGADRYQILAQEIQANYSHLDAIIHCATYGAQLRPLFLTDPELWLHTLQVNLTAPLWLSQVLLPLLQVRGGKILFSTHPKLRKTQSAYWNAFGVSQSALNAVIMELQDESENAGIEVHSIELPWLESNLSRSIFPDGETDWISVTEALPLYLKHLED